ncbi:hypothetical protein [Rhizobium beringeri]|uniref:hypothetical protein n=1 Tax=Rhizobium beringeri TaxID=3019934 RepID=UPI003B5AF4E8
MRGDAADDAVRSGKSADQQAALMLVGMRERAVAKTQLANTIRGYAAEFGLTAAKGMSHLRSFWNAS